MSQPSPGPVPAHITAIFEVFATLNPGTYDLNDPSIAAYRDQYIEAGKEWIDSGMRPTLDFNSPYTKFRIYPL